jgi:hypothetical protein
MERTIQALLQAKTIQNHSTIHSIAKMHPLPVMAMYELEPEHLLLIYQSLFAG